MNVMTRLLLILGAAALLLVLPAVPTPAGAQQAPVTDIRVTQVDTSNYPHITVYVSVTDASGQPIVGLQQRQFALTEDGTPVQLLDFSGGGGQVSTALVLDRSGSMAEDKLEGAQEAARTFVEQMRSGDQTALIAFDESPQLLQPLTGDQASLERSINRIAADGGTALYDSIVDGVDALKDASGRRVLLLLTDGQDCRDIDCGSFAGSQASLRQAIDYANRYEQPIYVVGLGARSTDRDTREQGIDEARLQRLSVETYGDYFYAPDAAELADLYAGLAGVVQEEYVLTYESPRPFYDGTHRDIRIQIAEVGSSNASYLEHHLINVQSQPLVGLTLLVPLVLLLFAPMLAHRFVRPASSRLPTTSTRISPIVSPPDPEERAPATGKTLLQSATTLEEYQGRYCAMCGNPLRPSARYCGTCGAVQPNPTQPGGDA